MTVRRTLAALLASCSTFAQAAGGHHAVDDAAIVEVGQCQLETWADAYRGAHGSWHLGPACRVGAWELGLNIDGVAIPGEPRFHGFAPQAKWVTPVAPGWTAGIVLTASSVDGHYTSFQPLVPVTWEASSNVLVHFNVGRDLPRTGRGRTLAGIAAEWAPHPQWSFVAERFNDVFGRAARIGVRWQPDEWFSLDLSHARARDARGTWWTLGATYVWERR